MQHMDVVVRLDKGMTSTLGSDAQGTLGWVTLKADGVPFIDIFVYDSAVARNLAAALLEAAFVRDVSNE